MCTQKMRALSYIGAEKITFPPKPDRQTDIHTYRRTDIGVYRVASLLKRVLKTINQIFKTSTNYQTLVTFNFHPNKTSHNSRF